MWLLSHAGLSVPTSSGGSIRALEKNSTGAIFLDLVVCTALISTALTRNATGCAHVIRPSRKLWTSCPASLMCLIIDLLDTQSGFARSCIAIRNGATTSPKKIQHPKIILKYLRLTMSTSIFARSLPSRIYLAHRALRLIGHRYQKRGYDPAKKTSTSPKSSQSISD